MRKLVYIGGLIAFLLYFPGTDLFSETAKIDHSQAIDPNSCLNEASIPYKGLDCPTCAYMVDKRMGKVEGVVSSKMLFRERRFFLTGTNINYDEARQIIKDGTLTPGPIRVTLCGTLKTYEGEKFLQDSVGDRFQLKGVSATQWEEMEKLPKVKVEGVLDETNTNLVEVTQINP